MLLSNLQSHSGSRHFLKKCPSGWGQSASDFWGECDGPTAELSSGRILTPLPVLFLPLLYFPLPRLPPELKLPLFTFTLEMCA